MATYNNVRAIALILKEAAETLYTQIATVYGAVSSWNLTADDLSLPAEGDVKAEIQAYSSISPGKLNLNTALNDVLSSTEPASPGVFALPATASPISFSALGQVPLNVVLGQQGVDASLTLFRASILVKTIESGINFEFDILVNDVSILTTPFSLAAGSQQVQITADFLSNTLSPGDILSYKALAGSAESVSSTLWVQSAE